MHFNNTDQNPTNLTNNTETDRNPPMTDDKLFTSLPANTIMAKLANHVQRPIL